MLREPAAAGRVLYVNGGDERVALYREHAQTAEQIPCCSTLHGRVVVSTPRREGRPPVNRFLSKASPVTRMGRA